jgi:hypothetical protein
MSGSSFCRYAQRNTPADLLRRHGSHAACVNCSNTAFRVLSGTSGNTPRARTCVWHVTLITLQGPQSLSAGEVTCLQPLSQYCAGLDTGNLCWSCALIKHGLRAPGSLYVTNVLKRVVSIWRGHWISIRQPVITSLPAWHGTQSGGVSVLVGSSLPSLHATVLTMSDTHSKELET